MQCNIYAKRLPAVNTPTLKMGALTISAHCLILYAWNTVLAMLDLLYEVKLLKTFKKLFPAALWSALLE